MKGRDDYDEPEQIRQGYVPAGLGNILAFLGSGPGIGPKNQTQGPQQRYMIMDPMMPGM
jgi:hypothetical protein